MAGAARAGTAETGRDGGSGSACSGRGSSATGTAQQRGNKYGGGAAAQPDADGGTACLAFIARTGAPRGAAPPHSVTIQALPIYVQVVTSETQCLFLPNMT